MRKDCPATNKRSVFVRVPGWCKDPIDRILPALVIPGKHRLTWLAVSTAQFGLKRGEIDDECEDQTRGDLERWA
jgi:hypothetical protein